MPTSCGKDQCDAFKLVLNFSAKFFCTQKREQEARFYLDNDRILSFILAWFERGLALIRENWNEEIE